MNRVTLLLLAVLVVNVCCAQVEFTSSGGEFTVTLPAKPTEGRDTIPTTRGRLPRYSMMVQSLDKRTNLMYIVAIHDASNIPGQLMLDSVKADMTNRLATTGMGVKLIRESKIDEPGSLYEVEWVYDYKKLGALHFVRLFRRNGKLYRVETIQNAGRVKFSTEPNEITTKYFQSFKLRD